MPRMAALKIQQTEMGLAGHRGYPIVDMIRLYLSLPMISFNPFDPFRDAFAPAHFY